MSDRAEPWLQRTEHGIILRCREIDSTQDEVLRLARVGRRDIIGVRAEHQTQGRGRRDRTWYDVPGSSLLVSYLLPARAASSPAAVLGLAAGVALVESIIGTFGLDARLVWPNDVIIGDRKVAGILVEIGAEGFVVVGLGVNVGQTSLPAGIAATATSLIPTDAPTTHLDALEGALRARLLGSASVLSAAPSEIIAAWRRHDATSGLTFTAVREQGQADCVALGIADDGALVVRAIEGGEPFTSVSATRVR